MAAAGQDDRLVRHVRRVWMLPPFLKAVEKRKRERSLLDALGTCVERLRADPTSPGLNLETIHSQDKGTILSARIDRAFRLILTPVTREEIGLLYFDNHDEAYRWADRFRERVPTMLRRTAEVARGTSFVSMVDGTADVVPAVRGSDDAPLLLASSSQWHRMIEDGIERYLAYLDDDQRRIAELNASGLLLVKGAAGTGKTAVAIHRALWLARQPRLDGMGPSSVLYLCFNRALAVAVQQIVRTLEPSGAPSSLTVKTVHSWCLGLLNAAGLQFEVRDDAVRNQVNRAFGRLSPAQKQALAPHLGPFVFEEIEAVVKANALADRAAYLRFNRKGRRIGLKQAAREAIWSVYEQVHAWQREHGILTWNDVPARALEQLDEAASGPLFHGVVVDEGQDLSPVMARLVRRLADGQGQVTVLADPAQQIYDCGFQWTQRELRAGGSYTRWLKKPYRTTREIFDLARPLLADDPDLADDLAEVERPARSGPRPVMLACVDADELRQHLAARIAEEAASRPANQIGAIAHRHDDLDRLAAALAERGVAVQVCRPGDGDIRLAERSVKLVSMFSAKGLDFPSVYVLAPDARERGWEPEREAACRRLLYVALTRSSERLTVGLVYGRHHPLVGALDPACFDVAGSQGRALANTAG